MLCRGLEPRLHQADARVSNEFQGVKRGEARGTGEKGGKGGKGGKSEKSETGERSETQEARDGEMGGVWGMRGKSVTNPKPFLAFPAFLATHTSRPSRGIKVGNAISTRSLRRGVLQSQAIGHRRRLYGHRLHRRRFAVCGGFLSLAQVDVNAPCLRDHAVRAVPSEFLLARPGFFS
jgi:hypothetical protein